MRTRPMAMSFATSVRPEPALLVTTVRSLAPCSSSAWVSSTGTPELPKPLMKTVLPSRTPSTASASDPTRLSSTDRFYQPGRPADPGVRRTETRGTLCASHPAD